MLSKEEADERRAACLFGWRSSSLPPQPICKAGITAICNLFSGVLSVQNKDVAALP